MTGIHILVVGVVLGAGAVSLRTAPAAAAAVGASAVARVDMSASTPVGPSAVAPVDTSASTPVGPSAVARLDVSGSEPPPSTWDRQQSSVAPVGPRHEGRSLVEQLVRTVISLLAVVALIYVLGRFAMARLGRARGAGGAGLRVVERVQLDARHALFVVEVSGKRRLLVGAGGDEGVTLLAELEGTPEQPTSGGSFAAALQASGGAAGRGESSEGQP